jgi:hypothetical protein
MTQYCETLRESLAAWILIVTVATISTGGFCGEIESPIVVSVALKTATKRANVVTFTIKNVSSAKVTLHPASLPGASGGNGFLSFYAFRKFDYTPLPQFFIPANPVGEIELPPGKEISEEVDLDRKFLTMNDARVREDLHVFWSYQPGKMLNKTREYQNFAVQGGMVLLPRFASKTK